MLSMFHRKKESPNNRQLVNGAVRSRERNDAVPSDSTETASQVSTQDDEGWREVQEDPQVQDKVRYGIYFKRFFHLNS
jgi:hypothetical protein